MSRDAVGLKERVASPALKPSRFPRQVQPMLCTLVSEPFDDPNWVFEPKLDGQRVLARFDGKKVELISRRGHDDSHWFPEIPDALKESLSEPALLDGEIVCLDEHGHSSFRKLQQRFHLRDPQEIARRAKEYPAILHLFDLLYLDRYDLRSQPLSRRKELLREAVQWSERIRWTESTPREGIRLYREACHRSLEGIIAKRLDSPYVSSRSRDWVKIKCIGRQEFVIGGFTAPQGTREVLGALLVGYYEADGRTLVYAGKVGTGFTRETLLDLGRRFQPLAQARSPFDKGTAPGGSQVHWVKPELVAEIAFAEWTQNDMLRQPRFEGLRLDKKAREVRREMPKDTRQEVHPAESSEPEAAARRVYGAGKADVGPGGKMPPSTAGGTPAATRGGRPAATGGEALAEYKRKRGFTQTAEPPARAGRAHEQPLFVIQEHHARRLHYDFRLEAEGVLKSWAVTKAPTLEPSVRRLAVRTEDHPLDYADFEGEIPAGQYGAGQVAIWDWGTYENRSGRPLTEGLAGGKIEFELHGEKLKGKFALVRMAGSGKQENWLLLKMKEQGGRGSSEEGARPARGRQGPQRKREASGRAGGSSARSGGRESGAAEPMPETSTSALPFTISHADKVMYPEKGYTKADVLRYYASVAGLLLPHLRDRPMTLERLPDGVRAEAPRFWQKHTPAYYPDWIRRLSLVSRDGKRVNYTVVNDGQSLLYLVNQGTLTFHPWLSRCEELEHPDFVLFDLDPGEASFGDVMRIAKALHQRLEAERVENFVKTSGKSGLHVLVPWTRSEGYDEAREWALSLAKEVTKELPAIATVERRKVGRRGRAYIDVMQNAKGHHVVPPYVLRAVPAATVSTPLEWDELTGRLRPEQFDLQSALKRFERQKRDLMAGLLIASRPKAAG